MNNSYIFTVTNVIHVTLRKVLLKCMQYRKLTEDIWNTQLNDHIISNPKVSLNGFKSKGLQEMIDANLIRNESFTKKEFPVSTIINSSQIQPNTEENNYSGSQEIYESTDNKIDFSEKDLKRRNDDIITYPDLVSPNDNKSEKTMTNNDRDTNKKLIKEKESDILQRISDEFWLNYNTGWEELLNRTDIHELFDNYL